MKSRKNILEFLIIFVACVVGGWLGARLNAVSGFAAVIWPPTGIAIGAMLLLGYRVWPAITLGSVAINLLRGASLEVSFMIALGNTLEPLCATYFLKKFDFPKNFESVKHVPIFFVVVSISCLISATIGTLSLFSAGAISESRLAISWLVWMFSNALGAFVVIPLILSFQKIKFQPLRLAKLIEAAALLLALTLLSGVVLFEWAPKITAYSKIYLMFTILIWAAARFELIGSSIVVLLMMFFAILATELGRGAFSGSVMPIGLLHLQAFVATLSLMGSMLAAFVVELRSAQEKLKVQNESLEGIVSTRTNELLYANAQLKRTQFLFEEAQLITKMGWWSWDIKSDRIHWSKSLHKIFETKPEKFSSSFDAYLSRIAPEDRMRTAQTIKSALASKTSFTVEHRVLTSNGVKKSLLGRGGVILDERGEVASMLGTTQDVTELKRIEEELTSAKQRADDANQAKTAFLTNMSHEIRTPLGIILGFTELLVDPTQSDADRKVYAQTIRRNGVLLFELINDILDLAKIEAGHLHVEKFEIKTVEFLDEIRDLMEPKANSKGLKLVYSTRGPLPETIFTDSTRLRQIFVNMIGNALKFTQSGRIEIRSHLIRSKGQQLLAFDIADTGIGVSPEQKAILFRRFVQADNSTTRKFGGTGLGLDLSRKFAKKLGGDLELLASRIGQGSVFRITIDPGEIKRLIRQPIVSPTAETISARQINSLAGKRVLLVEDSVDNQNLVVRFLSSVGASVDCAPNGEVGWKKAIEGKYDVVLMDIQMPRMDGFEATRHLRENGYSRPVIALTAHGLAEERDRCLHSGFSDYLSKPVNRATLIDHIAHFH